MNFRIAEHASDSEDSDGDSSVDMDIDFNDRQASSTKKIDTRYRQL